MNSPLESPADQIPDSLDYQIQQKFQAAEFQEKMAKLINEHSEPASPAVSVRCDDYHIVSDSSMHSDTDVDLSDDCLQHELFAHFASTEGKDVAHMITPLLEPGNYSALCVLSAIPTKAITQLWDHRVGLLHADRYCQLGLRNEAFFEPNELLQTGCLMPIAPESSYVQQMSHQIPTEKILIFDIAGQSFAQERVDDTTPDLSRFPAHEQHDWYDEFGEIPKIPMTTNRRVFSEPVEVGKCFDIQEIVTAMSRVAYEVRIPTNSDILVVQFKGQTDDLTQVLTFLANCNRLTLDHHAFESFDQADRGFKLCATCVSTKRHNLRNPDQCLPICTRGKVADDISQLHVKSG